MGLAPGSRYERVRRLTVGGMAEIWLARHRGATDVAGFERTVVLKQLLPHLAEDPAHVAMFLDEARLGARLHHPNIAQVLDVDGDARGGYFLAIEYLEGCDLSRLLAAGPLSQDVALWIALGACAGLHHAHELTDSDGTPLGIVHRDVSPANLFVTRLGAVKLLDFGIARPASRTAPTHPGMLRGKVRYMSPEQAAGAAIDRRSDVFSLGVVLYEMITGCVLFDAPHDAAVLDRVRHAAIAAPSSVTGCAPGLDAVVLRALARAPEDRYQTAGELGTALAAIGSTRAMPPRAEAAAAVVNTVAARTVAGPRSLAETVAVEAPLPARRAAGRRIGVALVIGVIIAGGWIVYRSSGAPASSTTPATLAPPSSPAPIETASPVAGSGLPSSLPPAPPPREIGRDRTRPPRETARDRAKVPSDAHAERFDPGAP